VNRFVWPLLIFLLLAGFLAVGLRLDPHEVPSPLIDKPAPDFRARLLTQPDQFVARQDLVGKVWMLNVWASWCVPCREEHPVLVDFARRGLVPIYGLNYKDTPPAAEALLRRDGNPYAATLVDPDGRIGIDYGVTGVPESYLIDRSGVIRYKHIGPFTPEVLQSEVEPLLRRLNG
jgi:cytochrome c biogenesis protein CcmG/thiol:disulfide interchange protein DsbE